MLDVTTIASADHPMVPTRPRTSLAAVSVPSRRRTVLKAVGFAGLALGGSVLTIGASQFKAFAETSPGGNLQGWDNCGGVDYNEDFDSGGIYAGSRPACNNPDGYISSGYCNSNGWHRQDTVFAPSITYSYAAVSTRCWGGAGSKNAWRWESKYANGNGTGQIFRCSDGREVITTASGTTGRDSVCRFKVN